MTEKAPWRKVVETTRNPVNGSATNFLECGHHITFRGEKALDAKYVKRRRCRTCLETANEKGSS